MASGIELTARVAGAVYLRILTDKNNMRDTVKVEIRARGIKISLLCIASSSIAKLRKLVRKNELKMRIDEELKEADIQYIKHCKPTSKEMKDILSKGIQQQILDKEDGLNAAIGAIMNE